MKRILPVAVAVVLLLCTGLVHGLWTERWGSSHELRDAAARVQSVPLEIAGWLGEPIAADAEAFDKAGSQGHWSRTYRLGNEKSVTVILMCGRAGRMSVHTPEVCYRGIGYAMTGGAAPYSVEGSEFRTARFVREQGAASELRILWSWKSAGKWQAPGNPRWHFRGEPYLYKLYLVREVTGTNAPLSADPAIEFLGQLLPALEQTLN